MSSERNSEPTVKHKIMSLFTCIMSTLEMHGLCHKITYVGYNITTRCLKRSSVNTNTSFYRLVVVLLGGMCVYVRKASLFFEKKVTYIIFFHTQNQQNQIILTSNCSTGYKKKTLQKSKKYLNK